MASSPRWVLSAALILSACLDPDDSIPTQAEPFYYASGMPVYLQVKPTRLSIETDQAPLPLVSSGLGPLGVRVDSITRFYVTANHWLVWLHPGLGIRQAEDAAAALRRTTGIAFASSVYQTRGGGCDITLVNRLVVKFRSDASAQAITALNARLGTRERPEGSIIGDRRLRYPVGSRNTPLEIAAYYDRHPLVEWADPDKMGCITLATP